MKSTHKESLEDEEDFESMTLEDCRRLFVKSWDTEDSVRRKALLERILECLCDYPHPRDGGPVGSFDLIKDVRYELASWKRP